MKPPPHTEAGASEDRLAHLRNELVRVQAERELGRLTALARDRAPGPGATRIWPYLLLGLLGSGLCLALLIMVGDAVSVPAAPRPVLPEAVVASPEPVAVTGEPVLEGAHTTAEEDADVAHVEGREQAQKQRGRNGRPSKPARRDTLADLDDCGDDPLCGI